MEKLTIVILFLFFLSCSNPTTDIPSNTYLPTESGIILNDSITSIDTSVVLLNENLPRLTELIEKAELKVDTNKTSISPIVFSFLQSLTADSFSIANPNENWQVGCTVLGNLPKRQLNYLGQSKTLTVMTYYKGGWGKSGHIIIVEHNDKKILDFWSGLGHHLNTKDSILKHLKRKTDLNSNFIYL